MVIVEPDELNTRLRFLGVCLESYDIISVLKSEFEPCSY